VGIRLHSHTYTQPNKYTNTSPTKVAAVVHGVMNSNFLVDGEREGGREAEREKAKEREREREREMHLYI